MKNAAQMAARQASRRSWSILPDRRPSLGRGVPRWDIGNWKNDVKSNDGCQGTGEKGSVTAADPSSCFGVGHQNFRPAPTRALAMPDDTPESGVNATYSSSPRRKKLGVSATSTPPPATTPYNTALFLADVLVAENGTHGGLALPLHRPVEDGFCTPCTFAVMATWASPSTGPTKAYGRMLPKIQPARARNDAYSIVSKVPLAVSVTLYVFPPLSAPVMREIGERGATRWSEARW